MCKQLVVIYSLNKEYMKNTIHKIFILNNYRYGVHSLHMEWKVKDSQRTK